jgi:hypothetical protein
MFTKRHEQELAEIKALTYQLGERFQDVLEELEGIKEAQDQLAARGSKPTTAKRGGRDEAEAVDGGSPESEAAGAKRARRRQRPTPVAVAGGAKSGKRRGKASRSASNPPGQATRRRAAAMPASPGDGPDDGAARKRGGGARKRGGGARKQRQSAEPAPTTSSDEE